MVQSQKSSVKQKKTNKRDPSAQGAGAGGHCAEVGATLGKRRSSLLEEDQRSYPLLHWPLLHLLQSNRASSGRWRGSPHILLRVEDTSMPTPRKAVPAKRHWWARRHQLWLLGAAPPHPTPSTCSEFTAKPARGRAHHHTTAIRLEQSHVLGIS